MVVDEHTRIFQFPFLAILENNGDFSSDEWDSPLQVASPVEPGVGLRDPSPRLKCGQVGSLNQFYFCNAWRANH